MQPAHESPASEKDPALPNPWLRRILLIAGLVGMAGLAWFLWSFWDQDAIQAYSEEAGPWVFFGLMALLPAIGFPAIPLYLLAGATYGNGVGLLGTWIAIAINQALCYWLARSAMRPFVLRALNWAGIRLPEIERGNELRFTILVKLTPGVPVFAKNYLLGLADVSFATFFPVSLLIAGIFASSVVVLGTSILEKDPMTALPAVLFLALAGGAIYFWHRRRSSKAKVE